MTRSRVALLAVVAMTLFVPRAFAQISSRYERVLVPVHVSAVPGAYGSRWETEMWYRTDSDELLTIFPIAMSHWSAARGVTTMLPIFYSSPSDPGQFIYVQRSETGSIEFDLRLFNRAEGRDSWGTEIPVVREREMMRRPVMLINIPTSDAFRVALRVYGDPVESAADSSDRLVIRVFADEDRKLIGTLTLPFEAVAASVYEPRYAQALSLIDLIDWRPLPAQVSLEIRSENENVAIWAFASVTSRATQHVSLITPSTVGRMD